MLRERQVEQLAAHLDEAVRHVVPAAEPLGEVRPDAVAVEPVAELPVEGHHDGERRLGDDLARRRRARRRGGRSPRSVGATGRRRGERTRGRPWHGVDHASPTGTASESRAAADGDRELDALAGQGEAHLHLAAAPEGVSGGDCRRQRDVGCERPRRDWRTPWSPRPRPGLMNCTAPRVANPTSSMAPAPPRDLARRLTDLRRSTVSG